MSDNTSGWCSTTQAAKALNVSERTVRRHVENGLLSGEIKQRGKARALEIEIDSVTRYRDRLIASGHFTGPQNVEEVEEIPELNSSEGSVSRAIERLFVTTEERAQRIGRLEARLELSERAESTRRAELDEIRHREEEARDRARAAADRARQAEQRAEELRAELDAERGRSLWSRIFGLQ